MVIIFIGNEILLTAELAKASESKRMVLPMSKQEVTCKCCLELLNTIRDKIGTAVPIKAIGPQKAVVKPVRTEEIRIK